MIDVRSAFPTAREKNRRTVRGKKPARYLVNAPTMNLLIGKMYPNLMVYHSEVYRGYRRHWYLVIDTPNPPARVEDYLKGPVPPAVRYGYVHIQEHERSPFEANCNSIETLQHMCLDIERRVVWNTDLIELTRQVAQQLAPGGSKAGSNFDFIEMVKKKFPEHFAPPPQPKPISNYNPFYTFEKKPYKCSWDEPQWGDYAIDDVHYFRR